MFRRSPRALLAWAGALGVALLTARVVGADLAHLHRQARELGPRIDVVVAARDVPIGWTVTEDDIEMREVFRSQAPDDVVTSAGDVVGKTVLVPLLGQAMVLTGHLADPDRDGLEGVVPEGMRAMRVVVEDSLLPGAGDLVDVLATFDPTVVGPGGEPTVAVAGAATVLAADDRAGDSATDDPLGSRVGVTLLVTVEEARRLAFALAHGVVTLALVPPEDACCKTSSSASSRD